MPNTVDTVVTPVYRFLELEVRTITIEKDNGKQTFNAYKTFQKNGKKMDVKFTRDVTNAPKSDCLIKVDVEDMNIDKNRKYPILWVKKIVEVLPLPKLNRKPEDYKELTDNFQSEDDLPF